MSNSAEPSAGKDTGTEYNEGYSRPYLAYWEQVYATTQSAALKQKAATILGIKQEKK